MTLQLSDFTATHNFLVNCDYQAELNETCKSRAHIICKLAAACDGTAQSGGDPDALEPALAAQAVALDAIFREDARIAALSTDIMSVQTYMGFALKAQAQCRVTGETVEKIRTARAAAPAAPKARPEPSEDAKSANELLARWLAASAAAPDPEKSPNELLKRRFLGGVAAGSYSPNAAAEPQEPQNSPVSPKLRSSEGGANELLAEDDGPSNERRRLNQPHRDITEEQSACSAY